MTAGNDGARKELVERLAALSHEQWAGWTEWMLEKWDQYRVVGDAVELYQDRWRRQVATPYEDLPEQDKESDRVEARKVLALVDEYRDRGVAEALAGQAGEIERLKGLLVAQAGGCPCLHVELCHPDCTCAKPHMSTGCARCCSYGSPEQQKKQAERLAAQAEELNTLRSNGGIGPIRAEVWNRSEDVKGALFGKVRMLEAMLAGQAGEIGRLRGIADTAQRWADAETPSDAIRWAMELRVALGAAPGREASGG